MSWVEAPLYMYLGWIMSCDSPELLQCEYKDMGFF